MSRRAFPSFTGARIGVAAVPSSAPPPRGGALRWLAWLMLLCLLLHGMGIATGRIAARLHVHAPAAEMQPAVPVSAAERAMAAAAEVYAREHGFGVAAHESHGAHGAHPAAADHHHGDHEPGVVYLDGGPAAHADTGITPPHRAIADLETLTRVSQPETGSAGQPPPLRDVHCEFDSQCHAPLERPPR